MERVLAQGDTRPMAGRPEAMEQLKGILRSREALYRQADRVCETSGKPLDEALGDLEALIREMGLGPED